MPSLIFLATNCQQPAEFSFKTKFRDPPQISIITQSEVLGFPHDALSLQITQLFISQSDIHPLNDDVVLRAIDLR